ncbi:MAG TPA: hypothetical protein VH257_10980, partial [Chloroflexota bacterium]|nr:hypothetical protein [Chloroflexota bacterium]
MAQAGRRSSPLRTSAAAVGAILIAQGHAARRQGRVLWRRVAGSPPRPARDFLPRQEASPIEQRLRPVAARLRWRHTLEAVPLAGLLFGALFFWGALLARAFGAPLVLWLSLLGAAVVAVWLVVRARRRRVGPFEAARSTDATLALRERLATALELVDARASGVLAELQVQDATAAATRIVPQRAVPVFAPGSTARRTALRRSGLAAALLSLALLIALWPSGEGSLIPDAAANRLALAQTGRPEETLAQPPQPGDSSTMEGIDAHTDRPNEVGDQSPGMVGSQNAPGQQAGAQGQQQGQPGQQGQQGQPQDSSQQAQQDAQNQQNANLAQREQALRDLGDALRQSQTARQAGEALRGGDTQRAAQQLNQVAEQVSRLTPGDRQSLSQ